MCVYVPRNLIFFRFAPQQGLETRFVDVIGSSPVRDPGPLELFTAGFSPIFEDDVQLTRRSGNWFYSVYTERSKIIPAEAFKAKLKKRIRSIELDQGIVMDTNAREAISEEIRDEMMAVAFVKEKCVSLWIDLKKGYLAVGTASQKTAEAAVEKLRMVLENYAKLAVRFVALKPCVNIVEKLTKWLSRGTAEKPFVLGIACTLIDPIGDGKWSGKAIDLCGKGIKEYLADGMLVSRLGLVIRRLNEPTGEIEFVIDELLGLRSVLFQEVENIEDDDGDVIQTFDAVSIPLTSELENIIQSLSGLMDADDLLSLA